MTMTYTQTPSHVLFLRGPFSNFAKCQITIDGYIFNSAEQAFMYKKAVAMGDKESANKLTDLWLTPAQAKAIGRSVSPFTPSKWTDEIAYAAMLEVNREKYKSPYYSKLLKDTGNRQITECNPRDNRWSCGLSENDPDAMNEGLWLGKNLLGKVLMQIRDEL